MSDPIKHECGLVVLRLRKPLSYYQKKYGTAFYGLEKLYLLMEKQRNRGQDGVGVATMKLGTKPGYPFIDRLRSNAIDPISDIFETIFSEISEIKSQWSGIPDQPELLKENFRFSGELILGHLRYGTQGQNSLEFCHPFITYDRIPLLNIALAGNFNVVNVKELFKYVGLHPGKLHAESDLAAMLEVFRYFVVKADSNVQTPFSLIDVLRQSASLFDGGYHVGGFIGNGDGFVLRDPIGIRPSYYYIDDEIAVATSERPALQTVFDVPLNEIRELEPGHALIMKANGKVSNEEILKPEDKRACSFERIYFSRGNDRDIYKERLSLGHSLAGKVLEAVHFDFENTVFSYIPNTAEVAFYGLVEELKHHLVKFKVSRFSSLTENINRSESLKEFPQQVRVEKMVVKDVKMRTFITEDSSRNELVAHVYDIAYGVIRSGKDTLVIIDDSIVRGTTLRQSILKMLDRLNPKRIIVLSSAPQIRYPDCYGIDMSKMGEFIAFRAAIDLLQERGEGHILDTTYQLCQTLKKTDSMHTQNAVRCIYSPLTAEEISDRIAKLIAPEGMKARVDIIYQSIEDLHKSCPDHLGDWYFTGDYPTAGGNRVVNQAFLNFMENRNERGY